jgi:signal transduction histidine kinase
MQCKGFVVKAFHIPLWVFWSTAGLSTIPFLLHILFGVSFALSENTGSLSTLLNTIFNAVCATLAFLTVLLCYIDFLARKDVSSPILGISLLCASIIDVVAILYESNILETFYPYQPIADVSSFIGLFSRTFHAVSLLIGVLVFLTQSKRINRGGMSPTQFVIYISLIILLLTSLFVIILINNDFFPRLQYPELLIARPFDLLPLVVYLFLAVYLLPKFYKLYPSLFAQALFLSLIPASILQLHLSIGSSYYYDNDYMIALFLKVIMYFIPFAGIAFNYYATVQNERKVIRQLNYEAEERTKAEQMLTSIFNTSPSGIIAYSALRNDNHKIYDFKIELYNDTARNLNAHFTNWEGGRMSDLFGNNWENGLFEKYVRVVEDNEVMDVELYAEHLDKWYRIAASRRGDGVTVVFNDINKLKDYEGDLEQKVAELNRSNSELEEFAYVASHDLQEPLRKIRTFSDRLTEVSGSLNEKSADYLLRMNNAAVRMQNLINDLMEYSRVSRNHPDEETVNMNNVWADILSDLDMVVEQKQADISATDLPVIVTNKVKVHQLFYNLLSNSLKFSTPGKKPVITLVYQYTVSVDENTRVRRAWHTFTLSDNGIGFDEMYSEKIFQLFQRLHGKGVYEGSGIGLAICKKIIEQLKGKISVNSKIGEGTSFIINLPGNE